MYSGFKGYPNEALDGLAMEGVTIVKTAEEAIKVVDILEAHRDRVHSWDTETVDLDIKKQSPVGNGSILCASCFAGPDLDFGNGPRLFIDNFGERHELIQYFKQYMESNKNKKIWHNYGFDRHMMNNHQIEVDGFYGDTMQMARLVDPSRGPQEYSLAKSTIYYKEDIRKVKLHYIDVLNKQYAHVPKKIDNLRFYQEHFLDQIEKTKMKQLFSYRKVLKNGEEGKTLVFPETFQLHTDERFIADWVEYSCLDAETTFFLYQTLVQKLADMPVQQEGSEVDVFFQQETPPTNYTLFDLYQHQWLPLGRILTDMERTGVQVDIAHFNNIHQQASKDILQKKEIFTHWVVKVQRWAKQQHQIKERKEREEREEREEGEEEEEEGEKREKREQEVDWTYEDTLMKEFNQSSPSQLQQLFFAPFDRKQSKKKKSKSVESINGVVRQLTQVDSFGLTRTFKIENPYYQNGCKQKKYCDLSVIGLGISGEEQTESGLPQCDTVALRKLAGVNPSQGQYGQLYNHLKAKGQTALGEEGSMAIMQLLDYKATETLQSTFILPMPQLVDTNDRVHCSLNVNTETGRLSSRKPNLQNQPALEKDKYKIREGFKAKEGCKLVVADYGQLELRVLAHMTGCKTMLEAFHKGGDFHSRTAVSMYPHIAQEVNQGKLILEAGDTQGLSKETPLVKDKYASERRKAKAMNFSIAYGKSSFGFAKDWNISQEEAQGVVDRWYQERQEVLQWQVNRKRVAMQRGYTQTLMGRFRNLTRYFKGGKDSRMAQAGLRASINTPIQGGAADIVICAMVRIDQNSWFKENGWKLILQVHDELILEGPEDTSQQAYSLVKHLMEHPFGQQTLLVKLEVDAKICYNWYQAK